MNERPPYNALQRARFAPLRSPLSFETLGASLDTKSAAQGGILWR
jgi:hypothetical protein